MLPIKKPVPQSEGDRLDKPRLLTNLRVSLEIFNLTWLAMTRLADQRDDLQVDPPWYIGDLELGLLNKFPMERCITVLRNDAERAMLYNEWNIAMRRQLLASTHLWLDTYAGQTNQREVYRSQPWYHFARILRNIASHHVLHLGEREMGKGVIEARWRNKILWRGLDLRHFKFANAECVQFAMDQYDFAVHELE